MRITGERRALVCLLARAHIRLSDEVRAAAGRSGWGPQTERHVLLAAGQTLGINAALRELSPGRYRAYERLAERIWRRFG